MIDLASIKVEAGDGGDGAVSFRREKFVPRGGPDGGDGGHGGDIFVLADHNLATLMDFRSKADYKAGNGTPGGGKNMKGSDGGDLVIKVPVGTLLYQIDSNGGETLIEDMDENGKKILLAKGGRGGGGKFQVSKFDKSDPQTIYQGRKR